jgi:tricorn protease
MLGRWLVVLSLLVCSFAPAFAQGTRLLRRPTVSRDMVAFAYGGDLWTVARTGGDARRLTGTPSVETNPRFSRDGSRVAYSATVAGNTDVYVMSTSGGQPKRLTFHTGGDYVRGWTPDGKRIVFASTRGTVPTPGANAYMRLWTIAPDGGMPEQLVMPRAFTGSYSPDGKRIAYQPLSEAMFASAWGESQYSQWRRYRGGRTQPIHIMDLGDYSEVKLPWTNSNDSDPMWIGNTVYFLSDRDGVVNLYSNDPGTPQVAQLTHHRDFDIMSASAGPDAIVYEQAGYIHLLNIATGRSSQLNIVVSGDFPWAQPQMKKVASSIDDASISPTGVRVAFEARGDIYTVAAADGSYRNLTQSSGVHERNPAWSPDGAHIAWLSDASGEYQLMIGDQRGEGEPRAIALPSLAYFSDPVWSPDARHLLLQDSQAKLWVVDAATGRFTAIDTNTYDVPARRFEVAWSPDSRWVAYSKLLDSHYGAIFLYSLDAAKRYQITDGMADATAPAFDASGKYLYFLASTNYALSSGWVDMSAMERPVRRSIYLAVLSAHEPSPLPPASSDEAERSLTGADTTPVQFRQAPPKGGRSDATPSTAAQPGRGAAAARATAQASQNRGAAARTEVDVDGIEQRIIPLPAPAADYSSLTAGSAGTFFYVERRPQPSIGQPPTVLWQFQLADRKPRPFLDGVRSYSVSADAKKIMYHAGRDRWGVIPADRPAKPGDGMLKVDQLQTMIDPKAEWAEIFRESWRLQREFFYDAKMHGNDWNEIYEKYSVLVPYVEHRADLSYLMASVGGELTVGHSYIAGEGDVPDTGTANVGLLGADLVVDHGRYRIKRIYTAGSWNPQLQAPLSVPGLGVSEGDYILAVNGRDLAAPTNLYSAFVGTAGRPTTIRVSRTPTSEGSRLVTVEPIDSDEALRTQAWVEGNRRMVDSLSGGRLAYVWLPNTGGPGYTAFNRYYFAQQDKQGVVIDERYNQGGAVADYIIDQLSRQLMGYFAERAGKTFTMPMVGIYGPKVMVINESAGSGGDALPYYFRLAKLGPLVGTRTWGGLVGTIGVPQTIDNGGITAPDLAFYDLQGKWAVENEGIAPDIEVENTPADVIRGRDPQLERAVAEALDLLAKHPQHRVPRPAPINRVKP